jgi:hypothetical protein
MNKHLWLVIAISLLASCSGQKAAIRDAAKFGCQITPDRAQQLTEAVCIQAAKGPIEQGGKHTDASMLEQNAPRTMSVSVPIEMPNGDVAAEVVCQVNTHNHSVTSAQVTKGPTTKEEADYLRSQGACAD